MGGQLVPGAIYWNSTQLINTVNFQGFFLLANNQWAEIIWEFQEQIIVTYPSICLLNWHHLIWTWTLEALNYFCLNHKDQN